METITKRAKQPALSGTGQQNLTQYERRLRTEEDLTAVTVRNSKAAIQSNSPVSL